MRAGRAVFLLTMLAALACAVPGAAPADTGASPSASPSFKVTISPQYATAGQTTTFQVTIVNPSSSGTMLQTVALRPPSGFTAPSPAPGSPLRSKTKVQNRTETVQVALTPGTKAKPVMVSTNAPTKCGQTVVLPWSVQGLQGAAGSQSQLPLDPASSVNVTVLCPHRMNCGVGGKPCNTRQRTSTGTYAVVSNATAGTLRETVNVGDQLSCGAYQFRDPNWYDSLVVPPTSSPPTAAPVTLTNTVTYKIVNTTKKGVGFCLGAAYDFTTASGGQAPAGTLPNGNPGFIGLLPRCSKSSPPCITSLRPVPDASTVVGSDVVMRILIPEGGDPWGHG